jgi:hypothetical protein
VFRGCYAMVYPSLHYGVSERRLDSIPKAEKLKQGATPSG